MRAHRVQRRPHSRVRDLVTQHREHHQHRIELRAGQSARRHVAFHEMRYRRSLVERLLRLHSRNTQHLGRPVHARHVVAAPRQANRVLPRAAAQVENRRALHAIRLEDPLEQRDLGIVVLVLIQEIILLRVIRAERVAHARISRTASQTRSSWISVSPSPDGR